MALTKDVAAKATAILVMLEQGFPRSETDRPTIEGMAMACADAGPEAVARACQEFARGALDRDHRFPPTGAELAARARVWQGALDYRDRKEEPLYTGILDVDFGGGKVIMRGLTAAEQDRVLAAKGRTPDGRSLAYKPAAEIRKALDGDLVTPAIPAPRMKRMAT